MPHTARKAVKFVDVETSPPPAPAPSPKRTQILTAARNLFLDHGFDGVTMDMVTLRAGVSKATLYVYFAGKESLFAASMEEELNRINGEIMGPFEGVWDSDEDIETVLGKVARTYIEMFLSERTVAVQRAIYGALPRFREMGQLVFGAGPSELIRRIAKLLSEWHARGTLDLPDPIMAARQFVSLSRDEYDLAGMLMLPRPDRAEIDRSVDAAVELFMARYRRAAPGSLRLRGRQPIAGSRTGRRT